MIARIKSILTSDGLRARALRGTGASVGITAGGQVLRFLSNLVLTRLLFPEAFGLMALVQVIITGLSMLSTFGLRISVMQSSRGDDEKFLNTCWTVQVLRGILLWLAVVLFADTLSTFYDQPQLADILPWAALGLVVQGFNPTKTLTAQRHLQLGRLSALNLLAQAVNLVFIAVLAYLMGSVWALVIGMILHPLIALILLTLFLKGPGNYFCLEKESFREIFKLGKYLFISTIATYVISQSDRAFLGLAVPIDVLGIYGIALALAMLPATMSHAVSNSVVFPLYRMRHPRESAENQAKIFRARRIVAGSALGLACVLAAIGPWLVTVLYDDRYALAGPMIVALCAANIPVIALKGIMNAALAKGDSFRFMVMNVTTAVFQTGLMYMTIWSLGILGAGLAIFLAPLLSYPLLAVFAYRYHNWDPRGDMLLMGSAFTVMGVIIWYNRANILLLIP